MNGARRWLAIALVAAVLLSGMVIGVVVDRLWLQSDGATDSHDRRPRTPPFDRMINHFRERLDLTDEQVSLIEGILEQTRAEAEALHAKTGAELDLIRDRSRDAIRALLTPEQVTKYDELSKQFDEHHDRMRDREHGPGDHERGPHGPDRRHRGDPDR